VAASGLGGRQDSLLNRTKLVGGDFFKAATKPKAAPAGRDVYVMRGVLHDWPDTKAQQILDNVRVVIGVHGILDFCSSAVCLLPNTFASRRASWQWQF